MTGYRTTPKADDDLLEGARWICADNPSAARRFLNAAFEAFDRLVRFPESAVEGLTDEQYVRSALRVICSA